MLGVIDTSIATELAENHSGWCVALFVTQIFLACICSFFIKEDLRRIEAAKKQNKSRAKSESDTIPNTREYGLNLTDLEPSSLDGQIPAYGNEISQDISKFDMTGEPSQICDTE